MKNVVLYIAMSLDGFIADQNGNVDWLGGDGTDKTNQGSYADFIQTVDTIILGYKTYHQIVTELFPNEWIYTGKTSYVLTHHEFNSKEGIIFTDLNINKLIDKLKHEKGKDIWICGGASVVNQLLDFNLIDKLCITIIPTILGAGVSLFTNRENELKLTLLSSLEYNGMMDLVYEFRK